MASVKLNDEKMRQLMGSQGKGQKSLVHDRLSLRTIQRALKGQRVRPAVLNDIATQLGVGIDVLRIDSEDDDSKLVPSGSWPLALHRIDSAARLASELTNHCPPEILDIRFDLDPDEELAELVADFFETCAALNNPKQSKFTADNDLVVAGAVRFLGHCNALISKMAERGAYVFVGSCFCNSIQPDESIEEFLVTRLVVSSTDEKQITVHVDRGPASDDWEDPPLTIGGVPIRLSTR